MSPPRSRWLTVVAALGAVALAGYLVVFVGLRLYVTPGYLRTQLQQAVTDASNGRYVVDFDEISVGWDLSLRILGGRLVPAPGNQGPKGNTHEASFGRFSLEGVHLWQLVRYRRLHVRSLRLRRPELRISFVAEGDLPSLMTGIHRRFDRSNGEQASISLAVDEITVTDGLVRIERDSEGARQSNLIEDVDLVVRNLAFEEGTDPLERIDVLLTVGTFQRTWSDGRQQIDIDTISISSRDSSVTVSRFSMEPPTSDSQYLAGLTTRKDLLRIEVTGIVASSFDVMALIDAPVYRASRLTADSLRVDVLSDRRLPPSIDGDPPNMPAAQLAALHTPVAVDSVVVRHGSIVYREIPTSGEPEGVVAFDDVSGLIVGIGTGTEPVVATLTANLFGSIPTAVTLWLPLTSPTFNLRYTARIGPGDASAINTAAIPLEGIELSQGVIDSVWLETTVVAGRASGTLQGEWRDLKVRLVERATGKSNVLKRLGSVAANTLVIPTNNPSNDRTDPRVGVIAYEASERDSFFGFLWNTVKSGALSIIGAKGS